jgi:hypothetical protein
VKHTEHITEAFEDSEALLLPRAEYDHCMVGIGYRFNAVPLAVYDIERVLQVLEKDGMTEEEAIEWYEYNIIGGWVGDGTPIFINLFQEEGRLHD